MYIIKTIIYLFKTCVGLFRLFQNRFEYKFVSMCL